MRNRYLAALFAAALLASACSGSASEPQADEVVPSPSPTEEPTCPLTGQGPVGAVDLARPAIGLKIENSPESRPQTGLEAADVVFEEVVEGGVTRFLAIYHCGKAVKAGPVRSARFDDANIGGPFTRLLAFSGANGIVKAHLQEEGMILLEEGSEGLFRDPPGATSVHALFAHTERLRKAARKAKLAPPDDVFAFADEVTQESKKARLVTINFTERNMIEYRWEAGSWARYEAGAPFMTAAGPQIAVPNLLIQKVDVNNSSTIVDIAGNPSPLITLQGSNKALLFRDGRVVKGTWTISKEGKAPTYATRAGEPMEFAPGPIWIALVPSGKGTVEGSFSFSKKA